MRCKYFKFCLRVIVFLLLSTGKFVYSQGVLVSWQANPEPDIAGYFVHYGPESKSYHYRVPAGDSTEYILKSLPDSGVVYFAVTAVDEWGNESEFSDEVSIYIDPKNSLTDPFELGRNYPNPFNPMTRIPYVLERTRMVRIVVYDILGREIKVLVNKVMQAGIHEAVWDGTNDAGLSVGNGVYIYRLVIGTFSRSKKMVMAR